MAVHQGNYRERELLGMKSFRVFITTLDNEKLTFEAEAFSPLALIGSINERYPDCEIDCIEPLDLC